MIMIKNKTITELSNLLQSDLTEEQKNAVRLALYDLQELSLISYSMSNVVWHFIQYKGYGHFSMYKIAVDSYACWEKHLESNKFDLKFKN